MANKEKISIRFETDIDNELSQDNTLLVSGPLDVFATTDNVEELYELAETEDVPLGSIVFVINVHANKDDLNYRGAYFRFEGYQDENDKKTSIWQEILLGTHTHDNIENLNKFSNLDLESVKEESIIKIGSDGSLSIEAMPKSLPDLPKAILDKINERKEIEALEPSDYEWHHLDAPLDQLEDTYDWKNPSNLAVGNCRELYYSLLKSDKKLYLLKDGNSLKLATELSSQIEPRQMYIQAKIDEFDFSGKNEDPNINIVEISPYNPNRLILVFDVNDIPGLISSDDEVFLFGENNQLFGEETYSYKIDGHLVIFELVKKYFDGFEISKMTCVIVKNYAYSGLGRKDFIEAINDEVFSLDEINKILLTSYITGALERKPIIPHLYLTTDDEGNIHWDNVLVPSQTFYAKTKILKNVDLEFSRNIINITFENVNYKVGTDFPILIIDNNFIFNANYSQQDNGDLNITVDVSPYLLTSSDLTITLLVIKNTAAGSISEELAENYVSKRDAVDILSHGKLDLTDYVKKTDLMKYSKIGHTHSEYATKGHNHDSRYANYYHTHPEIYAVIASITGDEVTREQIEEWLNNLDERQTELLLKILDNVGIKNENGNYYIEDTNIRLSEDLVNDINEKIDELNSKYPDSANILKLNSETATVLDALRLLVLFFERDTVNDDQVKLLTDIVPDLSNGPIGWITKDLMLKRNGKYNAGESIRNIITDMLNPYKDFDDIIRIITPTKIQLVFYQLDTDSDYKEIYKTEILDIKNSNEILIKIKENESAEYFSVNLFNEYGEKCVFYYYDKFQNVEKPENLEVKINNIDLNLITGKPMAPIQNLTSIDTLFTFTDNISLSWKWNENKKFYDSYGMEINVNDRIKEFNKDFEIIKFVHYPEYVLFTTNNLDDINLENLKNNNLLYDRYIESGTYSDISLSIENGNNIIVLGIYPGLETKTRVLEKTSMQDVLDSFSLRQVDIAQRSLDEQSYWLFFYEVLDDNITLDLRILNGKKTDAIDTDIEASYNHALYDKLTDCLVKSQNALVNSASALEKSSDAVKNIDKAVNISETAVEKSDQAIAKSEEAISNSENALERSNSALNTAGEALIQSNLSTSNSETARKESNSALETAKQAEKQSQTALEMATQASTDVNNKQDILVSGENIKTINNQSLLGDGNIEIEIIKTTEGLINNSGFINKDVNDLSHYYNKDEIDNRINNIKTNLYQVVNELPETGEDGIVYLVGNQTPYRRYIWENNMFIELSAGSGDVDVNLDGYVQGRNLSDNYIILGAGNSTIKNSDTRISSTINNVNNEIPTSGAVYSAITTVNNELSKKQGLLDSGNNIKTINGESILGSGNITVSATSTYTNPKPTTIAVGGIPAGTTFDNVPITEIFNMLFYPYVSPKLGTVTLKPNNGGTFEKGTTIALTGATVTLTKGSAELTSLAIFDGQNKLSELTSQIETSNDLEFSLNISDNKQLKVDLVDDAEKVVSINSTSFNFVYPYYYGALSSAADINETNIKALTKSIISKGNRNFSYTLANQIAVVAYPKSYGHLRQIKDSNGYDLTESFNMQEINITGADSTEVVYYVYSLFQPASAETSYTFSF